MQYFKNLLPFTICDNHICYSPSHFSQTTFFWRPSFLVVPLYISSSETPSWCTTFFPAQKEKTEQFIKASCVFIKTHQLSTSCVLYLWQALIWQTWSDQNQLKYSMLFLARRSPTQKCLLSVMHDHSITKDTNIVYHNEMKMHLFFLSVFFHRHQRTCWKCPWVRRIPLLPYPPL